MNRSLSSRQMKKQNVFSRISKMGSWFSLCKFLGFTSGRTQNPPVLWLAEMACSCPEQPLSATHGRQKYHTLDFARKVVCHETAGFIGFFLPLKGAALLWIPPAKAAPPPLETTAKGTLSPLEPPANRALPAPIG